MAQGIKRDAYRTMNCLVCGKTVLERKLLKKDGGLSSWYLPKKFCSIQCAGAGYSREGNGPDHWPTFECEKCGKVVPRRKGQSGGFEYKTRFCSRECQWAAQVKGDGYHLDQFGYRVDRRKRYEHRAVMEGILGRKLKKNETVHHINGIRHDNRPENLELWSHRHGKGQRVTDLPTTTEDIWSGNVPSYLIGCAV